MEQLLELLSFGVPEMQNVPNGTHDLLGFESQVSQAWNVSHPNTVQSKFCQFYFLDISYIHPLLSISVTIILLQAPIVSLLTYFIKIA